MSVSPSLLQKSVELDLKFCEEPFLLVMFDGSAGK